jgi:hypothetical protein
VSSSRVLLPATWRAAGLFAQLVVEGFRFEEIVDIGGELLHLAGELGIEAQYTPAEEPPEPPR